MMTLKMLLYSREIGTVRLPLIESQPVKPMNRITPEPRHQLTQSGGNGQPPKMAQSQLKLLEVHSTPH